MKIVLISARVLETRKPTATAQRVIIGEREIKARFYVPFDLPKPFDENGSETLYILSMFYAGSIALQIGEREETPVYCNRDGGVVNIWYYGDRKGDRMTRVIVTGYDTVG